MWLDIRPLWEPNSVTYPESWSVVPSRTRFYLYILLREIIQTMRIHQNRISLDRIFGFRGSGR